MHEEWELAVPFAGVAGTDPWWPDWLLDGGVCSHPRQRSIRKRRSFNTCGRGFITRSGVRPPPNSALPKPRSEPKASPAQQTSYKEIARRVAVMFRRADDIGAASTLSRARQALNQFEEATLAISDLLATNLSESGGNQMFFLIADLWNASKTFAFYQSSVLEDVSDCQAETSGDETAERACLQRRIDSMGWNESFDELFDAADQVLAAIPQ